MESSSVNRHLFLFGKNFVESYVYERACMCDSHKKIRRRRRRKIVIRTSITKKKQRKMRKNMAIIETWSYTLTSVVDGEKKNFSVRIWKYDPKKLQHFGTCDSRSHTHFSLLLLPLFILQREREENAHVHTHTQAIWNEKNIVRLPIVCECVYVCSAV